MPDTLEDLPVDVEDIRAIPIEDASNHGLGQGAAFLMSRLDDLASIADLIDSSGMARFDAARLLSSLRRAKAVVIPPPLSWSETVDLQLALNLAGPVSSPRKALRTGVAPPYSSRWQQVFPAHGSPPKASGLAEFP